jgi:F-type H+-transporting ATPase subunit alpha
MEVFKQRQYHPIPVEIQVAVIWAVRNGLFDDVPVPRIKKCQADLTDFLATYHERLLEAIARERRLTEALTASLRTALDEFKRIWK